MAEYLHPGVYIEETSYRAKSIEGVATSTTGFVGQCAYGPTQGLPTLVTSFEEFQRTFGGIGDLELSDRTTNYMAHAVRAYFDNGGRRLYISRVFRPASGRTLEDSAASATVTFAAGATFHARYPGLGGELTVTVTGEVGKNALVGSGGSARLAGLRGGDMVTTSATGTRPDAWVVREEDGALWLTNDGSNAIALATLSHVARVALKVKVSGGGREDTYEGLSTHPSSQNFIGNILRAVEPYDSAGRIWFEHGPLTDGAPATSAVALATALLPVAPAAASVFALDQGSDGDEVTSTQVVGGGTGDAVTGLAALAEVDDIAIVAAPGGAALTSATERQSVRDALISHCELLRYRFAILSGQENADTNAIREVRAQHDSTFAALYYPWVVVKDPNGAPGDLLRLPPDGFVAGIYGRSDSERGVHKAPANEVVRGVLRFVTHVNAATQDVLNPDGINCLRFFEGRGNRVWGARTLSSDPEWKYLNVRRLFIYLEHSIDRATQWAVFEPNNETLWLKVRVTVESFLTDVWRTGALMGRSPKEAFFVRCDRSTMTQGDLDNGRLVCLIGVAPTKPAEFVVFRIGQWTADASIL